MTELLTVATDSVPDRLTGIYVRALRGGSPASVDIAELDPASLLRWLRSRGGFNPWAENIVGLLLGHGHLVEGGPHILKEKDEAGS